ncbi:MAG: hopanoid biosynthesis-associated protein HpnK [Janthinobacterium lividum]
MRNHIISADDFGLSVEVNEAIELAHRRGILTTASLMVAGPAAADAVRRAKALPSLAVGLHLVAVEGDSVLPGAPPIGSDQLRLGLDYFFSPSGRRRLAAEIAGQYRAFAATGLRLDHANAHKHMHVHPTVGRLLIEIGRDYGLRALRIPAEPPTLMRACGVPQGPGARAMVMWTKVLRHMGHRAGLHMNDWVLGLAWSGHMTADRLLRAAPLLPPGLGEIYFHPATAKNSLFARLMPDYEPEAELAALLDPAVRTALGPGRTWT